MVKSARKASGDRTATSAAPRAAARSTGAATAAPALVALIVGLFFIWGGATSLNDILIPKLKALFSLNYTEAMLTQFAFFMAYLFVSLPAGTLVSRLGYLKGLVVGLLLMARILPETRGRSLEEIEESLVRHS